MEFITLNRIMDRLMSNPLYKGLGMGDVASYVKDFSSINDLQPIVGLEYTYVQAENYKAALPPQYLEIQDVFSCADLDPSFFEDNRLGQSLSSSIVRDKAKTNYGSYTVRDNIIFIDNSDTTVLEIVHTSLRVDESGFPLLPYDGSLMQAILNYVKWKHLEILSDSNMVPETKVTKAEREYIWYIAQYSSKSIIPSYDEAVSWANSWQRLLDDKNQGKASTHLRQGTIRKTDNLYRP